MPDGLWISVEPTPGYELLPPVRPWTERLARALAAAGRWARRHLAELLAAVVSLVAIAIWRREVLDSLATLAYGLRRDGDPRSRVLRALSLVECRARWAGAPRPPGLTPTRWYCPVAREVDGEPRSSLEGLVRLADWAVHAPDRSSLPPPANDDHIDQTCRSAVRAWTLSRFRATFAPRPRKVATT
jgi:hypothetical protein